MKPFMFPLNDAFARSYILARVVDDLEVPLTLILTLIPTLPLTLPLSLHQPQPYPGPG